MRLGVAAAAVLLAGTASAAGTKEECIAADVHAQEQRHAGKLHDALAQLDMCTPSTCPEMIRADCSQQVEEIERVMPSVVFDVKTSSGDDVVDATVEMDGSRVRDRLDARPLTVDPGEHTFVLDARGESKTVHVLVREGEKDRRISMEIAASPPPSHPLPLAASAGGGQRVAGFVLGAAGLFGVALGAAFGGITLVEHGDVTRTCPNNVCPSPAARDLVAEANAGSQTFATASTIAFIAGAVLVAAGVVVYITAPHGKRVVGLGPGGVFGTF